MAVVYLNVPMNFGNVCQWERLDLENQDGGIRHLGCCRRCIMSDVINAFCSDVSTFPPSLFKIGCMVEKCQLLSDNKLVASVVNRNSNNPTKFNEDWSKSKQHGFFDFQDIGGRHLEFTMCIV